MSKESKASEIFKNYADNKNNLRHNTNSSLVINSYNSRNDSNIKTSSNKSNNNNNRKGEDLSGNYIRTTNSNRKQFSGNNLFADSLKAENYFNYNNNNSKLFESKDKSSIFKSKSSSKLIKEINEIK